MNRCLILYSTTDGHTKKICDYIADYTYLLIEEDGSSRFIVEDAKGVLTPEFRLKKKLMLAIHNIDILLSFKKK